MPFDSNIPTYRINLKKPESDRWTHIIPREYRAIQRIVREADRASSILDLIRPLGEWVVAKSYNFYGGLYQDELASWADGLDMNPSKITTLNCLYEISGMLCSAAVINSDKGPIHIRATDWDLNHLGDATRKYWFTKGRRKFLVIGIAGHVGALSGMLPGRYSVTINWAPSSDRVNPAGFGPSFLLRDVLETCNTYEEAVWHLSRTELAQSAFFMVCGNRRNQACVIERTQHSYSIRKMENDILVVTNHYLSPRFKSRNRDSEDIEDSQQRMEVLTTALRDLGNRPNLDNAASCLDDDPVFNSQTFQQMAFCPKTGQSKAWRWVGG